MTDGQQATRTPESPADDFGDFSVCVACVVSWTLNSVTTHCIACLTCDDFSQLIVFSYVCVLFAHCAIHLL